MGILDKLLGRDEPAPVQNASASSTYGQPGAALNQNTQTNQPMNTDAQAVARYRYMLQTAPPEQIEAAHAEAFARLSPEQRRLALVQLSSVVPENERAGLRDDPQSLAQAATRAEVRQPGTLQNAFNQPTQGSAPGSAQGGQMQGGQMGGMGGMMGGGMMGGMGGMLAGGLLASVAGGFIGSSIANSFFSNSMNEGGFMQSAQAQGMDTSGFDQSNQVNEISPAQEAEMNQGMGADPMGDPADQGLGDAGGSDFGGGDLGGDFGGGDF